MKVLHSPPRAGLLVLICVAVLAGGCSRHDENSPAYQRRQAFKQLLRDSEVLHAVARGDKPYDAKQFAEQVETLRKQSLLPFPLLVPPRPGDKEKTRARPEIWSQPEAFSQARQKFDTALAGVTTAAQSGKLALIQPAVKRLEDTCLACHHTFRSGGD